MKQILLTLLFTQWIGIQQKTKRVVEQDVLGLTKNTLTNQLTGMKKQTTQSLRVVVKTSQPIKTIQPISCGLEFTPQTQVATHGPDSAVTGTMQ